MLKLRTIGLGVVLSGGLGATACLDAGSVGSEPEARLSPLVSVSYQDVVRTDGLFMPLPADVTLTATNVAVFACLSADTCREWTLELRPEAIEPEDVIEVCVAGKCFEPAALEILRHGRAPIRNITDRCEVPGSGQT